MAAIVRMRANLVILTPSAIRGLKLDALNSLCNLHFIGEPLHVDTFRSVDESVTISNLYGPTECTTFSTVQTICGRQHPSITIGKGAGLNTWVADIATGTALVPIGSAGELLLEGPLVAAGYRGDAVKTAAAFVYDPPFLLRGSVGHPGRRGRLYKTGDIVRYNSNGTLTFLGRKDSQVKINGQRVEFGDIESHINGALLPDFSEGQALVEFVTPQGSSRPMLVAFVYFGPTVTEGMDEADLLSLAKRTAISLDESLAARIPAFMIPSAYIPLQKIPVTATGKTDRRRLREMAKDVTWDQLISTDSHGPDRCQPGTEMEIQLQILWGTVLGVERSLIGAHDNFMRVGGDSVGAIRLASSARELGFTLNVADILKNPKLSDMAKLMIRTEPSQDISIKEFSLLKPGSDVDWAVAETSALCGVDGNQVEDLYPCTPLQEGLLALTTKRPGDYIIRCILELKRSTDVKKFCAAWEAVLESTPILRTRIVDIAEQGLVQAVIKQPAQWTSAEASSLVDFVAADNEKTTGLGMPLVRFGLVQETNKHFFVLTLHHAVYDGWALNLVFEKLENFYAGSSRHVSSDFRHFVKHISSLDNDAAAKFWKDQLQGSEAPTFPSLPTATFVPKSEKTILHTVEELQWPKTNVTAFTLVRAALSLLTAAYTNSEDVCFGVTSNGRQVGLPGVERMIGPTIATVPVRVRIDREQRLQAFLTQMQHQSIDMIAFEQFGLQQIRKSSPDAERACNFQSLLIVQPTEETAQWQSDIIARDIGEGADDPMGIQEVGTYALTLECHLGPDSLLIKANFDSNVIDELQVKRFTKQFEHVLRQICCSGSGLVVSDIDTTSRQDMEDIWEWNAVVPQSVNTPVHELISSVARRLPHVQAVCAWDGNWTYRQLDDLSNYVAHHLVGLGVGSQDIVPLLFEKSKWMPIAMLGVMKAGAASVAVDTSQPKDRLRMIIDQANPTVALSSADKLPLVRSLTKAQSFVVNGQGIDCLLKPSLNATLPVVDPSSRLYLVFTSGSTGVPKGVIIRHCNFASAIKHQKEVQGILPTSRVYDFASYAFDVAWANALLTFESGACLCIPSDADRKNDLNGSITRLKPTHADLTPSAALVLSTESLQQLDTLTLGGERLLAEYATKWSQFVTVKNSYGPSECTPTATFTEGIGHGYDLGASIGKPAGLNTWVVDPVTGQSLVPIGGVGELFLEGPLVGAGYLGDAEKTNAAFIHDPPFLLRGNVVAQPGRRGTLYKTGDIVRYNSDGSLTFVCRKDTQVKINGQRVELAEIESHLALYTATRQVATLLPSTGLCANKLVAIISLTDVNYDVSEDLAENKIELASSEHDQLINEHIEALQSFLRESLPQYMIPSLWVVLYNLPMTASGKQDNKALKSWLENMDETFFSKINNAN
ncbi:nonribosomal peptide synthase, partial [Aspergillus brasiliensis]